MSKITETTTKPLLHKRLEMLLLDDTNGLKAICDAKWLKNAL